MNTAINQNLKTLLEDLKSSDLVGISLIPQTFGLRLDFTFGSNSSDLSIELYQIAHLVFSQPLNTNNENYCFWVGEVNLQKIEKDGSKILNDLSYKFRNQNGMIELNSPLIYFRIEGDIYIEVVCSHYKIFHEFN